MDEEDIALMKFREINESNQPPSNVVKLFRTNAECQEYNAKVHQFLKTKGVDSIAYDKIQGNEIIF